jgi:hypothetical protein
VRKTTISKLVTASFDRAVCFEADWFWSTIVKGFVEPWQADARVSSHRQDGSASLVGPRTVSTRSTARSGSNGSLDMSLR